MNGVMMQLSTIAARPVVQNRTARAAIGVLVFALLTALGAHIAIPLVGGVPVTMQTLFVTLAGAVLGARLGAASQLLYLAIGAAGVPVFAAGGGLAYLAGPTGGYLLSYPIAAAVTGLLAGNRSFLRICLAMFVASLITLAMGWAQLSFYVDDAFARGVAPFIIGDVLKIVMGALITLRLSPQQRASA